jgi:hypothetical protein
MCQQLWFKKHWKLLKWDNKLNYAWDQWSDYKVIGECMFSKGIFILKNIMLQ